MQPDRPMLRSDRLLRSVATTDADTDRHGGAIGYAFHPKRLPAPHLRLSAQSAARAAEAAASTESEES